MRKIIILLAFLFVLPAHADGNGLVTKRSHYSAKVTLDRMEGVLAKKGLRVFARVSHEQNAAGVGLTLRPTELLIFGNPKLGTYFMTSNQTAGIDLPMKALAWEDAKGQVWLTYNDPRYIAERHGIKDREDIVKKMTAALNAMTDAALAP